MTNRVRKGWKVVRRTRRGRWVSVIIGAPRNSVHGVGRVYRPGQWTVPKKGAGPLCVFSLRRNAADFSRSVGESLLKRCLYQPSAAIGVWYTAGDPPTVTGVPRGTVFADAVMILAPIRGDR